MVRSAKHPLSVTRQRKVGISHVRQTFPFRSRQGEHSSKAQKEQTGISKTMQMFGPPTTYLSQGVRKESLILPGIRIEGSL